MEAAIIRKGKTFPFTLATATAAVQTLPMADMAWAAVSVGTMHTAAVQINVWVADAEAGPFYQLHDKDGTAVKVTLAPSTSDGRVYALPDEVFASRFIKLTGETTNTIGVAGTLMAKG